MARARLLSIALAMLAPACAREASPGGSDATTGASSSPDTGSALLCPNNPLSECTAPFGGGWPCGSSPFDDLDENCCPRPTCAGDEDCDDGFSCQPVASNGLYCSDEPGADGAQVCGCSADPMGGRPICVPDAAMPFDFCTSYLDDTLCAAAGEVSYDAEHAYYCVWAWIDSAVLLGDGTCDPGLDGEQRCITATRNVFGGDQGCEVRECTRGELVLETGVARLVGASSVEYLSRTAYFCGEERGPVGEWLPCDDPSFGACACTCTP